MHSSGTLPTFTSKTACTAHARPPIRLFEAQREAACEHASIEADVHAEDQPFGQRWDNAFAQWDKHHRAPHRSYDRAVHNFDPTAQHYSLCGGPLDSAANSETSSQAEGDIQREVLPADAGEVVS